VAEAAIPAATVAVTPCQEVTDVVLSYTPTVVYPETPVLFSAEVLTGSLPLTYTWEFGDGATPVTGVAISSLLTITHSYTSTGVYSVTLSTWNTCTIPPLTTTVPVTVSAHPCLTLTGLALVYEPAQVYTYTPALFTGEVLTGSLPATYTWDFGDGTLPLTGTATAPVVTATHSFTSAELYTVTLSAWNECTITPTQQAVTLTVAPCAGISEVNVTFWPTDARIGQVISFTAEISGGSPLSTLEWGFGDGITATGDLVTHVYTEPQDYALTLTAANPCSLLTTTVTLQIRPLFYGTWLPMILNDYGPPPVDHMGYGANMASADNTGNLVAMGFNWAKGYVAWSDAGAGPSYNWTSVNDQISGFVTGVDHVLLRINGPTPAGINNPPLSTSDLNAFRDFTEALAAHVSATWRPQGLETIAYEIWNEPNLDYEWGWLPPSPAEYTALLKKGYVGIKAGDSRAIVVSAGMATTGDSVLELEFAQKLYGTTGIMGDLIFVRGMYDNGAKGYFDVMGNHPYGGAYAPETPKSEVSIPVYFRRAEEHRQVMLDKGDASTPMWATEVGWVLDTDCDLGYFNWMKISESLHAQYLVGAYAYAEEHWSWMGPMFMFNLDFATVPWYHYCEQMRWHSITYRENPQSNDPIQFRQAFYSLQSMPKQSAW
jgi:PKD repeat protein